MTERGERRREKGRGNLASPETAHYQIYAAVSRCRDHYTITRLSHLSLTHFKHAIRHALP